MISTDALAQDKGPSVPKTITVGTQVCKINSIKLEASPFDKDAFFIYMAMESEPMGDDFEGFMIDKDNPSAGKFLGQVGRVKTNEYAYKDGQTKSGIKVSRDLEILRAVQAISRATGSMNWMEANNNKHETIEEYVIAFNNDAPFKDVFVKVTLGGREYFKDNYSKFDLFLVKPGKGQVNMEPATVAEELSKLVKFSEDLHIKRKKTDAVESFGNDNVTTSSSVSSDFEL
jgi:hypothetical protein